MFINVFIPENALVIDLGGALVVEPEHELTRCLRLDPAMDRRAESRRRIRTPGQALDEGPFVASRALGEGDDGSGGQGERGRFAGRLGRHPKIEQHRSLGRSAGLRTRLEWSRYGVGRTSSIDRRLLSASFGLHLGVLRGGRSVVGFHDQVGPAQQERVELADALGLLRTGVPVRRADDEATASAGHRDVEQPQLLIGLLLIHMGLESGLLGSRVRRLREAVVVEAEPMRQRGGDRCTVASGASIREDPARPGAGQPGNEHRVEFESLRLVDRHQLHGVDGTWRCFGRIVLAQFDEAEIVEERVHRARSVEGFEGVREMQEPQEVLVANGIDHAPETGLDHDGFDRVDHRASIHHASQGGDRGAKPGQTIPGLCREVRYIAPVEHPPKVEPGVTRGDDPIGGVVGRVLVGRIFRRWVRQCLRRSRLPVGSRQRGEVAESDPVGGTLGDPQKRHVGFRRTLGEREHAEPGNGVDDLRTHEETAETDDLDRDSGISEGLGDRADESTLPAEDGDLGPWSADLGNARSNGLRFGSVIGGDERFDGHDFDGHDRIGHGAIGHGGIGHGCLGRDRIGRSGDVGAQRLGEGHGNVGLHVVGKGDDRCRGPVVRLELDTRGAGNVPVEEDQVVHVGTTEAVDRLEVVAHRSERSATVGKSIDPHQFQEFALRHIGVLKLVEEHGPVSIPQRVGDGRIATHRFHGERNLVAEIEHAEPPLRCGICIKEDAQIRSASGHPTNPRGERPIVGHGHAVGPECLNGDQMVGQR